MSVDPGFCTMSYIGCLLLAGLFSVAQCIVCTPSFCATVDCIRVEGCKGANQKIKPGGFCNCCPTCYTILGEDEPCREGFLLGGPPPTTECDRGLVCDGGKCTSLEALTMPSC